jgi:hypothetical protein
MSDRRSQLHEQFQNAIDRGDALVANDIRAMRARSKKAIFICKSTFWIGIALFNLFLWVPLPIVVSRTLLLAAAFICLLAAVVVPLIGLKKHQLYLELLKVNRELPKKKTVSEAGRSYIDQVRQQDRPLVNIEYELLTGSKWSGPETPMTASKVSSEKHR